MKHFEIVLGRIVDVEEEARIVVSCPDDWTEEQIEQSLLKELETDDFPEWEHYNSCHENAQVEEMTEISGEPLQKFHPDSIRTLTDLDESEEDEDPQMEFDFDFASLAAGTECDCDGKPVALKGGCQ